MAWAVSSLATSPLNHIRSAFRYGTSRCSSPNGWKATTFPGHPLFGLFWINRARVSGTPCFYATRVPVKTLFDCLAGGESLEEFLDGCFEGVSREQAVAVLELAGVHGKQPAAFDLGIKNGRGLLPVVIIQPINDEHLDERCAPKQPPRQP